MTHIEVRVTVRLPHDPAGNSPEPGDLVIVDDEDARIVAWMNVGYLVPTLRRPMPNDLRPSDAVELDPDGPELLPDGDASLEGGSVEGTVEGTVETKPKPRRSRAK